VVLGNVSSGELSSQEVIDKLVNPVTNHTTGIYRIYILRPEGSSSELSSLLKTKFPDALIKWVTLAEISRGTAAAIHRHPDGGTLRLSLTLFTPVPIGIVLSNGQVVAIVPRMLSLPNKKTAVCTTSRDNQTSVTIKFLTGKTPGGKLVLEGLQPQPKGVARIQVSFDIDADGGVVVTAKDLGSEAMKVVQIPAFTKADADAYWADESSHQIEQPVCENGILGELP
jgi:molecular chaperone DnaK (HSP70)